MSGPLSTLTPVPEIRLPSASTRCRDSKKVLVSHLHSVKQRLVAHDVGQPHLVRAGGGELVADTAVLVDDREQVEIYAAQCDFPGGIFSMVLRGGRSAAYEFLRRLRIAKNAVSRMGRRMRSAKTIHKGLRSTMI